MATKLGRDTVRPYSNVYHGIEGQITVTATDGGGNARSAVRRIFIWKLC